MPKSPLLPSRALIGMIHVAALPGTPRSKDSVKSIADAARAEAEILVRAGFDAILLENMHDVPYLPREVGPEIVATMTRVALAVRDVTGLPLGIQILAGANSAALAVAHAVEARFIRAEGFVFASVADEGLLATADAGPLLRTRRALGAEAIAIFADLKKKHSAHALTADVSLAETAAAAAFFGADGVVITGTATGMPTSPDDLRAVRRVLSETSAIPVIVGSGATAESLPNLLECADAVIVGSAIKRDGRWDQPVDPARAAAFVAARSR